jgi:dihydroneopterin aldolase
MLTVSLHGIRIHAAIGMYPEELIKGNDFEIDVDIYVPVNEAQPWPFVDYAIIQSTVAFEFAQPGELLETFAQNIHRSLKAQVPYAEKIKVVIRKLKPMLPGEVKYSQISYEG